MVFCDTEVCDNKIAYWLKSDHPRTPYRGTLCHYTICLRVKKYEAAAMPVGCAPVPPGPQCHTLNDWDELAVTAVAVMLSLKPVVAGLYFTLLVLWNWPLPDNLHIRTWLVSPAETHLQTRNKLCWWRLSKVFLLQRQTDRQGREKKTLLRRFTDGNRCHFDCLTVALHSVVTAVVTGQRCNAEVRRHSTIRRPNSRCDHPGT